MNSTTTTTLCTRAYIKMMRGRRGNHRCHKCGWFGHLARHCRQKEILEERRRKSVGGDNKFAPLLNKVCRRMKGEIVARLYEGKVQPMTCWGCREVGYVLWGCPNRAAQPKRAEAQQVRKVERRKCRECGGDNHWEPKCPSVRKVERRKCRECRGDNHWEPKCPLVRLWGEEWGLKRKWHEGEERAIRRGVLVERCE